VAAAAVVAAAVVAAVVAAAVAAAEVAAAVVMPARAAARPRRPRSVSSILVSAVLRPLLPP
jgi:hypothetical protein